jgi:hypothetical protein
MVGEALGGPMRVLVWRDGDVRAITVEPAELEAALSARQKIDPNVARLRRVMFAFSAAARDAFRYQITDPAFAF